MKRAILLMSLMASPALGQQMIGPAFNLPPDVRAIYAEQSRKIEAEIAAEHLARKCHWQKECIDRETDESTTGARPYQPYGAGAPYGWYERHHK